VPKGTALKLLCFRSGNICNTRGSRYAPDNTCPKQFRWRYNRLHSSTSHPFDRHEQADRNHKSAAKDPWEELREQLSGPTEGACMKPAGRFEMLDTRVTAFDWEEPRLYIGN